MRPDERDRRVATASRLDAKTLSLNGSLLRPLSAALILFSAVAALALSRGDRDKPISGFVATPTSGTEIALTSIPSADPLSIATSIPAPTPFTSSGSTLTTADGAPLPTAAPAIGDQSVTSIVQNSGEVIPAAQEATYFAKKPIPAELMNVATVWISTEYALDPSEIDALQKSLEEKGRKPPQEDFDALKLMAALSTRPEYLNNGKVLNIVPLLLLGRIDLDKAVLFESMHEKAIRYTSSDHLVYEKLIADSCHRVLFIFPPRSDLFGNEACEAPYPTLGAMSLVLADTYSSINEHR